MALRCSYQLQNYSLTSGLDLSVASRVPTVAEESTVVPPPVVLMNIAVRNGDDTSTAQVGDPLALLFEIKDAEKSPYSIFVRELIATDGLDGGEIMLIDSRGCPTDQEIMGPINSLDGSSKTLKAPFDAFKFPNSDVVQFKALVTPCLGPCQPVKCDVQDYLGYQRKVDSLGRRKRRDTDADNDLLVVQTIRIADKFHVPSGAEASVSETELTESEVVVLSSDPPSKAPPCLNLLVIFFHKFSSHATSNMI